MESVGIPPAELDKLIAAALVSTFPQRPARLRLRRPARQPADAELDRHQKYYQAIKAAFIANLNGYDPMASVEFAPGSCTQASARASPSWKSTSGPPARQKVNA